MAVGGRSVGRLEFELFSDVVPRTAENFRALCTGEKGLSTSSSVRLHYKGSSCHRLIPGFMLQGGDFSRGDGTGGESVYGRTFADENFKLKHDRAGLLSMANAGPGTNGSQFFLTFASAAHLDGKHVVFGRLLGETTILRALEALPTGAADKPRQPVTIVDCGQLEAGSAGALAGAADGSRGEAEHAGPLPTAADLMGRGGAKRIPTELKNDGLPTAFGTSARGGVAAGSSRGVLVSVTIPVEHDAPGGAGVSSLVAAAAARKAEARVAAGRAAVDTRGLGSSVGRGLGMVAALFAGGMGAVEQVEGEERTDGGGQEQVEAPVEMPQLSAPAEVGEDGAAQEEAGSGAAAPNPASDRMFALRAKLAAARRTTKTEVEAEARRAADPSASTKAKWTSDIAAKQAAAHKAKLAKMEKEDAEAAEAAGAGAGAGAPQAGTKRGRAGLGAEDDAPNLHVTAAQAERWEEANTAKAARIADSQGWNVMGPGAQQRGYAHRLKRLPGATEGGGSGAPIGRAGATGTNGDDLLAAAVEGGGGLAYGASAAEPAALDRMVNELAEVSARRAAFSRRRAVKDDGNQAFVNEGNRLFNARIAKDYDKYTVETRQALERGTAL